MTLTPKCFTMCSPQMPITTSHHSYLLFVGKETEAQREGGVCPTGWSMQDAHASSVSPLLALPFMSLFIEWEKLTKCTCRRNDLSFLHVRVLGQIATNLAAHSSVVSSGGTEHQKVPCGRCYLGCRVLSGALASNLLRTSLWLLVELSSLWL